METSQAIEEDELMGSRVRGRKSSKGSGGRGMIGAIISKKRRFVGRVGLVNFVKSSG